jgi:alpha-beta hydrolase superfamily lysophospholipase
MPQEYDFSKGVRGKHASRYASGSNVVVLEPDVASQFPTAADVNETLRAVAKLLQRRKPAATEEPPEG